MRRARCSCLMESFHLEKKWRIHRPSLKEMARATAPGGDRASSEDEEAPMTDWAHTSHQQLFQRRVLPSPVLFPVSGGRCHEPKAPN